MSEDLTTVKKQVADLTDRLKDYWDPDDSPLSDMAHEKKVDFFEVVVQERRRLRGHFGKIYSLQWARDSVRLLTASQDGKLLLWNTLNYHKLHALRLSSSWVMACAISPSMRFVASGGLDNVVSVHELPDKPIVDGKPEPTASLQHHEGYISCCRFLSESEVLSASGDSTCALWDVSRAKPKRLFTDHKADVMSIDYVDSKGIFVSGSCDAKSRVWDYRTEKPVMVFRGHETDVNSVAFMEASNGNVFGSGSDDSSVRLYDIRAYRQVSRFSSDQLKAQTTAVDFSLSGRLIFAAYDNSCLYAWDTLLGEAAQQDPDADDPARVSCLQVAPSGRALATGSWDTYVRILA